MKYYVDKNEVFRTYSNMLEVFSTVTKEWRTISFRVTDVVIEERGLVEIPEELFEVLDLLGGDELGGDEYCFENEKKLPRRIEKMDILQIRTFLTVLSQRERFCDGTLADAVEDGSVLKCLRGLKS